MLKHHACAGPACPEKPESKNPGGIPNVAAEVPLCPLFPVCQVPVLPLVWLPGSPAGLVLGAKLIQGAAMGQDSLQILAKDLH